MFYWLKTLGDSTPINRVPEGPYPKDEALQLKAHLLQEAPNLAVGLQPAWEAPFENMIRTRSKSYRFGKPVGRPYLFIYKVSKDKYFCTNGNTRVGFTMHRTSDHHNTIGDQVGFSIEYSQKIPEDELQAIEARLGGAETWDCGWSPACPEQ